jgi:MFS family permease
MVFAYLTIYFNNLNLEDKEIGFLISLLSLTTFFLVTPSGVISDRYFPKKLLQIGSVFCILYNLGLIYFKNFNILSILMIICGIGENLCFISINSLYYKYFSEDITGKKMSIFLTGMYLGFSLGPLFTGFFLKFFHFPKIFFLSALLYFFLYLLSKFLPETEPLSFPVVKYKEDIKRPQAIFLIFTLFFIGIHYGVEHTSYALFMKYNLNLKNSEIGLMYGIIGIWLAIVSIPIGIYFDKNKKIAFMFGIGLLISGTFQFLTSFTFSFFSLLLVRIIHTIGDAMVIFLQGILVSLIFPNERMGGNFGIARFTTTTATFTGAILSGILNSYIGYFSPFILSGIIIITTSLLIFFKRREIEKFL